MGAESVEASVPGALVLLDPSRRVLELRGPQAALAGPSHLLGDHEVCILQHLHVLLDAVEGEAERLRQFTDGGGTRPEQLEDPAAFRIREGEEGAIDWPDSRIARGGLAEEIAELKREPGKDMIAWGGATFAQSLTRLGLVDEYRLILQPVALGDGLPLFKDLSAPVRLELVDAQTYDTGAALHVYRPAPAAS
jgi:RibD C-terminal domain